MKKKLETVILLGIDCVDLDRLILAMDICEEKFEFADVKILTSIKSDHENVIPIKHIDSVEQYSKFVLAELDNYVDTEHVLIVQYDGFILNPEAWMDEFLQYDYVGAPWLVDQMFVDMFAFPEKLMGQTVVGNGGFCLRSKKLISLCAKLVKENAFKKYHPEDLAICVYDRDLMENYGIKFAPFEIAQKFSFEGEFGERSQWDGEFGFHGFSWTDITKWLAEHPDFPIDKEKAIVRPIKHN